MKKSSIIILFVVAAMIFSLAATALAADKSKGDYYGDINFWLGELNKAMQSGNRARINECLAKLRVAVYNTLRYLASIGEYDSSLMGIIERANEAVTKGDVSLLADASSVAENILGTPENKEPEPQPMHS